jgi:putative peptide zinc metalloprotease protein
MHWSDLTENFSDRVLSAHNLALLWLLFPVVKFFHELGHGYVAKAGGAEIHEMGILFLVFTPVPYVDASAANAFRSKRWRALVGAAGMLVETFIAAIALFVWVMVEPGLVRAVAFDTLVIAGISTLVFNGNPLLRYDGYYILADLIEMPNLAGRGFQYWRYLLERYVFAVERAEHTPASTGERAWFLTYAPLSFVYRMMVMVAITLFMASQWFVIGVVLAIWGAATMLIWPIVKFVRYLAASPRLYRARHRAVLVSTCICTALVLFALLVPMPLRIQTEGVVWLPEEAHVRAGADGFVREVLKASGTAVSAGEAVIQSVDPVIATHVRVMQARVEELDAKFDAQFVSDRVQAELARQEVRRQRVNLDRAIDRAGQLLARSGVSGTLILLQAEDLPGRFFRKGSLLGYVAQSARPIVRVVVPQDDVDLVRSRLDRAEIRLAERPADVLTATLIREVPAAQGDVPPALMTEGGGIIAADPRDPKGGKALHSMFQLDLELPHDTVLTNFGERVHVRFVHHPESLASQWYRRIRQVFLARFDV